MKPKHLHSIITGIAAIIVTAACNPNDAADDATVVADGSTAAVQPASSQPVSLPRTPSPAGARVFFITPGDGDTVPNPITLEFGIEGMSVVAAGISAAHSGHHHLLVDTDMPDLNLPIPADANHIHFGDASTSTELTLAPGPHTLRLLLADHLHIPHDPPVVSDPITITVQ
ncbi:MAG: DUF4399 domain-containing protein [Gammaproteobacteria bacterium]|nr:DUF4399 domain-containing protein [Gammaproteobacteria bacterium]MDH3432844.1 DUF4399 domain-containing protein [Gammaproteobacteria bacterium]